MHYGQIIEVEASLFGNTFRIRDRYTDEAGELICDRYEVDTAEEMVQVLEALGLGLEGSPAK